MNQSPASPRRVSMAGTETISCHCNDCNILICISFNDWIEISNSYSTYARPGGFTDTGLEPVEQIREGSKDSELEGCLVKPLRCHSCKTPLGVRCVRAPVEKTANVNRSYLKLAKMNMKSITSGKFVKARAKQRQNPILGTSPGDALACRQDVPKPTSSKKHPISQRMGREGESTEAPSSNQVFDLVIGPTAGPMLVPEEQGRDIERIMASVDILQREMVSLKKSVKFLMDRKGRASQGYSGDVGIPVDDSIEVSNGLSELDALKLEMQMMQQRIKFMEDSRSTGRWSPTVSGSAQVSRRPSSTIDEAPTLRTGTPANGFVLSTTLTPMSAYSDGGITPQIHAPERHDAVDGCESSSTGFPVNLNPNAVPPQKLFTTKPRTAINCTASRGRHGQVSMPPPQTPFKAPERDINRCRNSYSTDMGTPRTASTPIMGSTNSISLRQNKSQRQEISTDFHHSHPESHIYDDELDDDVRPQSSTGSCTGNSQKPASKTAHSRQYRKNESIQQQRLPCNTQRRKSVSIAPPAPKASNDSKPSTSHRESKRRKTTASDANTSNASAGSRELRPMGGRRGGQGLSVRI